MSEARVATVVVTYNRRNKLKTVLDRIAGQSRPTDLLVVVDNASTDGTREDLLRRQDERDVHVRLMDRNTGGAGGFAEGISLAYELGADLIWIMDDDCYPEPEALERLVVGYTEAERSLDRRVPFACSLVRWTNGDVCEMNNAVASWDWARLVVSKDQPAVLVNGCSFVSVLLPRWAVTRHGLPLREYFIWFDDSEYTHRLTAVEGSGVQLLDSVVVHDLPTNRGVNYGDVNADNLWKFLYGARNESSYRWHHEHPLTCAVFARRAWQQMRGAGVPWRLRYRVLASAVDGLRFDPQPEFPRSVL